MSKRQSNASTSARSASEYYCEYVCTGGTWLPVGSNLQSGYTCPSFISGCSSEGAVRREPPIPIQSRVTARANLTSCTYEYRNGRWELAQACVSPGVAFPADLEAYSKRHPEQVIAVAHLVMIGPEGDSSAQQYPLAGKAKRAMKRAEKKGRSAQSPGGKRKKKR